MKVLLTILCLIASTMSMAVSITGNGPTRSEACSSAKTIASPIGKPGDCDCSKKNDGSWVCAVDTK